MLMLRISMLLCIWGMAGQLFADTTLAVETTDHAMPDISQYDYVAGAVAGTIVGFGIGQGVQGRYKEIGWVFTLTDIVFLAATLTGVGLAIVGGATTTSLVNGEEVYIKSYNSTATAGVYLALTGLLVYSAFRIWETVDLWASPLGRVNWHSMLEVKPSNKVAFFEPQAPMEFGVPLLSIPL